MERSSLTIEEQETHINWSRGDKRAKIYVSDVTTMTKLDKLVAVEGSEWTLDKEYREKDGSCSGKFYSCPVEFISFRSKRVILTEEQKKAMAQRLHGSNASNGVENIKNISELVGEDGESKDADEEI